MDPSPGVRQSERPAFYFYQGYLAVIYGLVATKGLEYMSAFPSIHESLSPSVVFLFLGTFLVSFHFWYVCATVETLSQSFYRMLAGTKESLFQLFLVFDALVATAFAGGTLAMFLAIAHGPRPVFQLLLWMACFSLLYDSYSRFLTYLAPRAHPDMNMQEQGTVQAYREKTGEWLKEDCLFVVASTVIYFLYPLGSPLVSAVLFVGWAIILLLLDIELIAPFRTFGQRHLH